MKRLVLCMLLALVTLPIVSREIGGVLLPDNLNVAGQELQLNGAGLRKKAFIKVYACGLYMPAASSDADAILADSTAIVVRMHFIYKKVGAKNSFPRGMKVLKTQDSSRLLLRRYKHSTASSARMRRKTMCTTSATFPVPASRFPAITLWWEPYQTPHSAKPYFPSGWETKLPFPA